MSKYSKMLSMKNGSNIRIKKASVGMFARLLGMGAKKGVEMIGVSKKAIQEGAAKAARSEKFRKASEADQKGNKEILKNLRLKDFE
jgi:hypothetical protein